MTYSDKIYNKLYRTGEFADQIAYGLFAAKEVNYIKEILKHRNYVSDDEMNAFYTAEEAHIREYQNTAIGEIQAFSDSITEANADTMLQKVAEKVNGEHPNWRSFGINILAAFVWNIVVAIVGIIAIWQSDTFAKACISFFENLASHN